MDLSLKGSDSPGPIKVGFAALPITPEVVDTWNDTNGDAKFREKDGDTYNDLNNNGKFDAIWIAGFSNQRAANGVHDDVVDIRKQIPAQAGIDYALISSTHTHESNDLIGIWGESPFRSGVK